MKTSANDLLLYELCPRKWQFVKKGSKKLKQVFAFYRFSAALHTAVKRYTTDLIELHLSFDNAWRKYEALDYLIYKDGENWGSLNRLGKALLAQFSQDYNDRGFEQVLAENKLTLHGDGWTYISQPDYVGEEKKELVTVEYKTTDDELDPVWVKASDQLTGQAMAVLQQFDGVVKLPIKVYVCNFVKTGKVVWMEGERDQDDVDRYQEKISHLLRLMQGIYHPRRSLYAFGSPCRWCDFVEECYSKEKKDTSLEDFANA
jgi:hypothetical protein